MEWNKFGLVLQINVISLYWYIITEVTWGIKIGPPSPLLGETPPKGTIVPVIIVRLKLILLFIITTNGSDTSFTT